MSKIDELKELGKLLKLGVITNEEFENLKKELLQPLNKEIKNPKLIELEELLNSEAITEEEFESLKDEILRSNKVKKTSIEKRSFKSERYNFDTGVVVSIEEDEVKAIDGVGSSSIDSKNLDNFSYESVWEGKISVAGLIFRFHAVSFLIIMLSIPFLIETWEDYLDWFIFSGIVILVNIIWLAVFILDTLMELGIFNRLIKNNFSNYFYNVHIGNKSGNNINFSTLIDEESKIKNLESKLAELKIFNSSKGI